MNFLSRTKRLVLVTVVASLYIEFHTSALATGSVVAHENAAAPCILKFGSYPAGAVYTKPVRLTLFAAHGSAAAVPPAWVTSDDVVIALRWFPPDKESTDEPRSDRAQMVIVPIGSIPASPSAIQP